MAQLQDSARLMDPDDTHPFSQWFGPLLHASLSRQEGAAMVAAENDGPLLWLQQDEGWLLASRLGHPEADAVDALLQETGLVSAELPGEEQKMQVWTRLQRRADQADGLDVQLALARVSDSGRNWWVGVCPPSINGPTHGRCSRDCGNGRTCRMRLCPARRFC